jgi:hypothetical protein
VLPPIDTTDNETVAPRVADAIPVYEWLEELVSALGEIDPVAVLKAKAAGGFSSDVARLLMAALARHGNMPLRELLIAPTVKYLCGTNPAPNMASP